MPQSRPRLQSRCQRPPTSPGEARAGFPPQNLLTNQTIKHRRERTGVWTEIGAVLCSPLPLWRFIWSLFRLRDWISSRWMAERTKRCTRGCRALARLRLPTISRRCDGQQDARIFISDRTSWVIIIVHHRMRSGCCTLTAKPLLFYLVSEAEHEEIMWCSFLEFFLSLIWFLLLLGKSIFLQYFSAGLREFPTVVHNSIFYSII